MLRGHWRYIAAGVGFLILGGLGYAGNKLYQAAEQRDSYYNYQPASKPGKFVIMPDKLPAKGYQPGCENPQNNGDADLCAQWAAVEQVAESNRISSFNLKLSIASLWATVIATFLLIWNLIEQRSTARRQLRAYLAYKIEVTAFSLGQRSVSVKHGFVNTGDTPAKDFQMTIRFDVGPREPPDDFFRLPDKIGGIRSKGSIGAGLDTIKPKELRVSAEDADAIIAGKKCLFAFGRGTYADIFGRQHHINIRSRLYLEGGLSHFYVMHDGNDSS